MTSGGDSADISTGRKLAVVCLLFYLLFLPGHFTSTDEIGVYQMTRSLALHGSLEVTPIMHSAKGRGERWFSYFGPGQSVLALPLFAAGELAGATLPEPVLRALRGQTRSTGPQLLGGTLGIFFVGLYAPLASALLVFVFFAFERRLGASRPSAVVASLLLGLSTYVATHSQYFLRHTTESLLIVASFYCFVGWRQGSGLRSLAAGSLLASLVVLVRLPGSIAACGLAAHLAWSLYLRHTGSGLRAGLARTLLALLLPFAAVLAVFLAVDWLKWGGFASPMLGQRRLMTASLADSLPGFLVSPGLSIFVYSPPLLLAVWAAPRFCRRLPVEAAAIGVTSAACLLFYGKWHLWSGIWSAPGPRYLLVLVPLWMLGVGPWLDAARGRGALAALAILATLGAAVQIVLLAGDWSEAIRVFGYAQDSPQWSFVFDLARSPVIALGRLLGRGEAVDFWLFGLGRGWPGRPGTPGVALALFGLWTLALGLAVRSLLRDRALALALEARTKAAHST